MDKEYWDTYYKKHGNDDGISRHSTFAGFCQENYFSDKKMSIVELGSGNGRDAIYFAHYGHNIIAIDQSSVAINIEKTHLTADVNANLTAKTADFIAEDYSTYQDIEVFYSRFTLHAILKNEEEVILSKVYNALMKDGLFCIEARTTKDPLCGVGEYIAENTYKTDHYRRFIDSQIFLKKTLELGFKVKYFTEENGLSIYKTDDPVLMRLILEK